MDERHGAYRDLESIVQWSGCVRTEWVRGHCPGAITE